MRLCASFFVLQTPFEALRQKLTEKRRKRKQDKKERLRNLEASTTLITSRGKGKTAASSHRETNKISELETMQPDDDEEQGEFNMRSIAKEEKLREKLIPGYFYFKLNYLKFITLLGAVHLARRTRNCVESCKRWLSSTKGQEKSSDLI